MKLGTQKICRRLIREWLPDESSSVSLKTDLFEEAASPHCPLRDLGEGSMEVDLSPEVASLARGPWRKDFFHEINKRHDTV